MAAGPSSLFRGAAAAGLVLAASLASAPRSATAASLRQVTNFGPNPTNATFYLYVPDSAKPAARTQVPTLPLLRGASRSSQPVGRGIIRVL